MVKSEAQKSTSANEGVWIMGRFDWASFQRVIGSWARRY
jgi:hypothetical protein